MIVKYMFTAQYNGSRIITPSPFSLVTFKLCFHYAIHRVAVEIISVWNKVKDQHGDPHSHAASPTQNLIVHVCSNLLHTKADFSNCFMLQMFISWMCSAW